MFCLSDRKVTNTLVNPCSFNFQSVGVLECMYGVYSWVGREIIGRFLWPIQANLMHSRLPVLVSAGRRDSVRDEGLHKHPVLPLLNSRTTTTAHTPSKSLKFML